MDYLKGERKEEEIVCICVVVCVCVLTSEGGKGLGRKFRSADTRNK